MEWFIIVLIVILIFFIIRLLRMKNDIQSLNKSLRYIQENETNQLLTTTTFYKDICSLSSTMNEILEEKMKIRISSNKSNREFRQAVTNISHDLRTPLTSAIGYIQMIQSDKTEEYKKDEYLKIIEYRLKTLSNLTNDLLEYSSLIERNVPMHFEQININNLLRDTVSTFYDEFIDKNYKVSINIPFDSLYFMGDVVSFKRIFMNLIQNTLKYGTEIFDVSLDQKKKTILFRNRIANAKGFDVEPLLNRFYTSDKSRSDKSTGLGLTIVKELITSMGGTIRTLVKDDFLIIEIGLDKR
ncbi:HAMP domain-containing histidine kinase [Mycoplasmatota bacterium]|nr:HAMP domain-containing histidine kinase [Mycoplasmatota bacterium]